MSAQMSTLDRAAAFAAAPCGPSRRTRWTLLAAAVAATLPAVRLARAEVATVPASNTTSFRSGQAVPTVSLSGSTALKTFIINPGSTYLTPADPSRPTYNGQITLGDGSGAQPEITYTAPAGTTSFQLSPNNYITNDLVTGSVQSHSALTIEYHESGATEGVLELIDNQINEAAYPDNSLYNPNTVNAIHINRNKFGGNNPTGPIPTPGSPATANGFTLNYQPNGPRDPGAQSRVQVAVSDMAPTQGLSFAGTSNVFAVPGTAGYGKGNPALTPSNNTNFGTHIAGSNYQLPDNGLANMTAGAANPSYDPNAPRTGSATYGTGAWNTAGAGNLNATIIAQTATLFAANPGTGLTRINRTDAQWLQATGKLQNGAAFNFTERDPGSGTRNVAAADTGLDPSFAVGVNDRGDGLAPDGGTTQIKIGSIAVTGPGARPGVTYDIPGITFSNKTSGGSALRPTVQASRMAIGPLGLSDAIGSTKNAAGAPLRALGYRDDANDVNDNSNGAAFKNWSEDASHNPISTTGDLPSGTFVAASATTITNGSYVVYQNEQFVTVKVPDATLYNANVIKGDNGTTVSLNNGLDAGKGHDAADYIRNITNAVANSPLPNTTTLANPADTLLATGYVVPQLMLVQKTYDGLNVSSANPDYNSNYRNSVFLADPATPTRFNPENPATVLAGSAATYGSATPAGGQGVIKITNDPTLAGASANDGGNWLFGNFNQNGVRDFSAIKSAQAAQAALFTSNHGVDMFAGDPNNSTVSGLATPLANMFGQSQYTAGTPGGTAHGAEKGDLIVMGDVNGDGKFDGRDLYWMAHGAALADNVATDKLTSASSGGLDPATTSFADWARNGVLLKNQALDYMQSKATAQQKVDARAIVFDRSGTSVLADNDPTGTNAFNKFDVNRDGKISRQDAQLVDASLNKSYTKLSDVLSAVVRTDVNPAGTAFVDGSSHALDPAAAANGSIARLPFDLVNAKLIDDPSGKVGRADLDLITNLLVGNGTLLPGDANFDGKVDFADFVSLSNHFGLADQYWSDGNFTGGATIGFADFVQLSNHFGLSGPAESAAVASWAAAQGFSASAVPEPTALGLLGAATLGLLSRRNRNRNRSLWIERACGTTGPVQFF